MGHRNAKDRLCRINRNLLAPAGSGRAAMHQISRRRDPADFNQPRFGTPMHLGAALPGIFLLDSALVLLYVRSVAYVAVARGPPPRSVQSAGPGRASNSSVRFVNRGGPQPSFRAGHNLLSCSLCCT